MKLKVIPAYCLLIVGLAACGTTPQSSKSVAEQKNLAWSSTRHSSLPAASSCPTNEKSYLRVNTKNLVQYAWNCALLNKWSQLDQIGDLLAQKTPEQPWGAFYLSVSALGKSEYQRANWMIDLAMKKAPKMGLLVYQKGRIHWQAGEYGEAINAFEKATKLDNSFVDAYLLLAEVYFREQEYKKSESHFAEVVRREDSNVNALAGLAETKIKRGDIKSGVTYLEKAVNASPRSVNIRLRLAAIYETETKDLVQALSVYKRIDTLVSGDRSARSEKVPFDIKAKIRDLESAINKSSPGRKITNVDQSTRVKK